MNGRVTKKITVFFSLLLLFAITATSCGGNDNTEDNPASGQTQSENINHETLEDGIYLADFNTDNSMFHANEACNGKGTLTVKDGTMVLHVSMPSKNVVNLFLGLAEDAGKDGAELLFPTMDTVTYSDGMTEEVHGFDIPVPVIGEEFDLALLGTKGKWYDHKVSVSNPEKEKRLLKKRKRIRKKRILKKMMKLLEKRKRIPEKMVRMFPSN